MSTREDFEIYEIERNDKTWYTFKVEYIGRWYSPTKEGILKKQEAVREYVAERIAWVERENKKYYARLAEEERQRALLFAEAKKLERKSIKQINSYKTPLTTQQKKMRSQKIYDLMEQGYTMEQIAQIVPAPTQALSRLKHEFNKKKSSSGERM